MSLFQRYPFTSVITFVIIVLSLMPVPEVPMLHGFNLLDKWTHVLMYLGQAGAVWLDVFRQHGMRLGHPLRGFQTQDIRLGRMLVIALLQPILWGGLLEVLQHYCTGGMRSGDWFDWLADAIGAVVAWCIGHAMLLAARRRSSLSIAAAALILSIAMPAAAWAQQPQGRAEVTLQTTHGKVVLALYNETPIHRDNFLAQVRRGYYDGLLFHRIIEGFMVQCGDSASRGVQPQDFVNSHRPDDYRLPAEIRWPQLYHRRGVLAAARQGDDVNPQRASSPYEFYIVWGKYYHPSNMREMQERIIEREDSTRRFRFPPELQDAYEEYGGTPHLDREYTVFGEVIKGLHVIGQMQSVKTDSLDRPLKEVRIRRAWVSREL